MMDRISRIPARIRQDLQVIGLVKNWKELLAAKSSNREFSRIVFRNGVVINSPPEVRLNFLFHEIWIDKLYSPSGYSIEAGSTVFDIGANIGVFALYAATAAENVTVHSFEPFPENSEYFRKNVTESGLRNVTLHENAVGAGDGERYLHVSDEWITHSLNPSDIRENDSETIAVKCISLEQALDGVRRCDLMKLDCEGSEYEIIYSSSRHTLSKIRRLVGEYHDIDGELKNGEALRTYLSENGFIVDKFVKLDHSSGLICARALA